ncbi:AbrB/MazE/SpoVT family DNA-binding domain-containing protein [Lysinibacillus sp. UGB7]|uniref:AbrB/MazE/SpoVT family DNA-binding domain-containing protein n=1 Tax=Lysinibacillus sp. UGB7 TaxID=3411039 RepID=UPI003B7FB9DB
MYKASLTSKGQLTIPKEIRDFLELEMGDEVLFSITDIENKTILFEKVGKQVLCPACNGTGNFIDFNLPCFLCDQTKYITKDKRILNPLLLHTLAKNKVTLTIKTQDTSPENGFMINEIPKITLFSNIYPEKILSWVQDLLQLDLIRDYAPKRPTNPDEFMFPSNTALNNILDLLVTDAAKQQVRSWFK